MLVLERDISFIRKQDLFYPENRVPMHRQKRVFRRYGIFFVAYFGLINEIFITFFTIDLFSSFGGIGSNYFFTTASTISLTECSGVSHIHPLLMSLVGMFGWNRESIFYVEYQFLFDNFKWSFTYHALQNTS